MIDGASRPVDPETPIALTMGEPGGIGPEITVKAWLAGNDAELPPFFVIADAEIYRKGFPDLPIAMINAPAEANGAFETALPVLDLGLTVTGQTGAADPANANAVVASIDRGVELVRGGQAAAIVTNPIQKASLYAAGFEHPGHTEYLAELCGLSPDESLMMLAIPGLRVVPVTVHVPISEVAAALSIPLIETVGRKIVRELEERFGVDTPRLAIAGLNPHAGEDGTIGTEDRDIIAPAVERLKAAGIAASGPHSADTLFHSEARSQYDAVLTMYHDQALIPLKTINFHEGVNITLGLPIVRTSPDHGTALDIAGNGVARPDSLISALRMAAKMATDT